MPSPMASRPLLSVALACAFALAVPVPATAVADGPAPQWCGQARRTDDRSHAVFGRARQFKIVYAVLKGGPDRLAQVAPLIEADARAVAEAIGGASGGTRTVRFDRGTSCGPQYLDIQVVRLRHPAGHYIEDGLPEVGRGSALAGELRRATRPGHGRHMLVYVDGLGGETAQGETDAVPNDSRPGAVNRSNRGGRLAVVFGPEQLPAPSAAGLAPKLALHELFHALGAVQEGAPHSTAGGHCYDGDDVMCYDDASLRSGLYTDGACSRTEGVIDAPIDCGGDDYFSPAPAPGSYLATHWNVYDSLFFESCSDARVAASCGAATPPAPRATAATAPAGPSASGAFVRHDTGGRLGTVTVSLDVRATDAVATVSATPLELPAGSYRMVTCVTLRSAGAEPWEQCWTKEAGGGPNRFLEESLTVSRPGPGTSSVVAGRVEIQDASGRTLASTPAAPSLDVPAA